MKARPADEEQGDILVALEMLRLQRQPTRSIVPAGWPGQTGTACYSLGALSGPREWILDLYEDRDQA